MEEPPIIDVEPEGSTSNRLVSAIGCLMRLIPIATMGLALVLGALVAAKFIWGKDTTTKGLEKAAEAAKKAKADLKKSAPAETEVAPNPYVPGSAIAPIVRSSNRAIAKGSIIAGLNFEVVCQEYNGGAAYQLFILPYNAALDAALQSEPGGFAIEMLDATGKRIIPANGEKLQPYSSLATYDVGGQPAGWRTRGSIPLSGRDFSSLESIKLAWTGGEPLAKGLEAAAE